MSDDDLNYDDDPIDRDDEREEETSKAFHALLEDAYANGYARGLEVALRIDFDFKGYKSKDIEDAFIEDCTEEEEMSRNLHEFEVFEYEYNNSEDPDAVWVKYEDGVEAGIKKGLKKRLNKGK